MDSEPILALEGVTRRYGPAVAVDRASLTLHAGRIACLLGPSGCGKSTLLRMIAGLEPVDGGEVRIAGQSVSTPGTMIAPERRGVGLVFQDNALFPHLDVTGNIGFGLSALPAAERAQRVDRLLEQFHIAHLARSFPHMLSGGEQQRVAIARALAREPALLLLDEPFSGLDGHLRETVRASLLGDLRAAGGSVLVVTHDPDEAMGIADDLVLMAAGQILQTGTPADCYRRPVSSAAARLLGEMILLPGEVRAGTITSALGAMPAPGLPDGFAQLGLRPEALRAGGAGAAASLLEQRFVGNGWRVTVDLAGTPVTLRLPDPVDGEVRLGFDPAAACLFSA
ncbi:MAG: ABC transporter ATP-binding protein [Sphingomonadales bacterium]|nr:ABC transporter ATP-binding protein [Sphingomonadales bacterium]